MNAKCGQTHRQPDSYCLQPLSLTTVWLSEKASGMYNSLSPDEQDNLVEILTLLVHPL